MTQTHRTTEPSKSVSLAGLLAIISGCGLLLVLRKFKNVLYDWTVHGQILFAAIAVVLVLWGLKQLLTAIWPSWGYRRLPRLHRNRVMLPREGAAYLAIMAVFFVGSLLGRSNMLMLVFAMMIGPWVANGWIAFSTTRRNAVKRDAPKRAMAGELISVALTLENRKHRLSSWLMGVRDSIFNESERLEAGVLFTRVPPHETRRAYYQLRLSRRGVFDDDFHRIREYRWGDNPRAIHWRTSARRDALMVCEFHQSRSQDLRVLLDLWCPHEADAPTQERVELAVRFVATVCVDHLRQSRDSRLSVSVCGQTVTEWDADRGTNSVEAVLDMLALVKAGAARETESVFEQAQRTTPAGTRLIVVTTRVRGAGPTAALFLGNGEASERGIQVQVFEADAQKLAGYFLPA